jgi:hypothetical protein
VTDSASALDPVFAAAVERLLVLHPGDEQRRMLRSPGLAAAGAFYGFVTAADLTVKLPAERVRDLVADGRGLPCSPRPGRPMREWVRIPAPDEEACLAWLLEARSFVTGTAGPRTR